LTLLYSSLLELFLLSLLSLWRPNTTTSRTTGVSLINEDIAQRQGALRRLENVLGDNVLDGMAAGFGLRNEKST
jgi:hypothetical protein